MKLKRTLNFYFLVLATSLCLTGCAVVPAESLVDSFMKTVGKLPFF